MRDLRPVAEEPAARGCQPGDRLGPCGESDHSQRCGWSARTSVFEYDGLQAGDYDIRVVLVAADGSPGAIAVAKMKVRP